MVEKRKETRKRLGPDYVLWERSTRQRLGYLENISANGVMLVSGAPVEVGALIECRLLLPEEINGSREVTVDAQSLWCRRAKGEQTYHIGLKLVDVKESDRSTIEHLVFEPRLTAG